MDMGGIKFRHNRIFPPPPLLPPERVCSDLGVGEPQLVLLPPLHIPAKQPMFFMNVAGWRLTRISLYDILWLIEMAEIYYFFL